MFSSFTNPQSIAVVGAADDTSKLRGKLLKILLESDYRGAVYPVHPKAGQIQGMTAYSELQEIPGGVELVLIVTPGETVPGLMRDAVAAGAKATVIFSSGVKPDALRDAVGDSGLRYMGSNTEGYYFSGGTACTFAPVAESVQAEGEVAPRPGRLVSIVSQSGGLGFSLFGRGRREGLDFHAVITTGNEDDIECLDAVDYLLDEGKSGVILMFIEGLKTPSRLIEVASKAANIGVPIIVMKVGSSEAGQRAAVSHTAHLTGANTAYNAVFERYGIIRVFDMEEMLSVAAALSRFSHKRVGRTAIISSSGGAGAWAADLCGAAGIEVPQFSDRLQKELSGILPDFAALDNPVDVTAQAINDGGRMFLQALELLAGSEEIDSVIVNMGLAAPGRVDSLASELKPLIKSTEKPILFHSHILPIQENFDAIARLGAQAFHSFRGCAAALRKLDQYAAFQGRWARRPVDKEPGPRRLSSSVSGVLDNDDTLSLLGAYSIPLPPSELVTTVEQCLAASSTMGFPVALKIQSSDIVHKTEAGGVLLNVNANIIEDSFAEIVSNAKKYAPEARIDGVLVQKMMPVGHEVVIGVNQDADFGPLVMIGSGGVYLEVIKDVIFAPPPISHVEALALINKLKTAPILNGARGQGPADIEMLADLVTRIGDLARAERDIEQLDLNPVFVYPKGKGVVAVDALVVKRGIR